MSGETVYIAGGAVVSLKPQPADKLPAASRHQNYGVDTWWAPGLFGSHGKKKVTVRGRGILCGRKALEQGQRGHLLRAEFVEDLAVEGIVLREASVWSMYVTNCKRVRISNVKIIGHYVNNDGIPIGGTSDALVEDCFTHNADDSLQVKVWIPQRNVTFRNCVVWNDIGGSLGLMHECGAAIENVALRELHRHSFHRRFLRLPRRRPQAHRPRQRAQLPLREHRHRGRARPAPARAQSH